jgi:hypothetical protein
MNFHILKKCSLQTTKKATVYYFGRCGKYQQLHDDESNEAENGWMMRNQVIATNPNTMMKAFTSVNGPRQLL